MDVEVPNFLQQFSCKIVFFQRFSGRNGFFIKIRGFREKTVFWESCMLCENKNVEIFGKTFQRENPENLASQKIILGYQYVKFKFTRTAFTLVLSTIRLREKQKNSASFSSCRQTYTPSQTQLMGRSISFGGR